MSLQKGGWEGDSLVGLGQQSQDGSLPQLLEEGKWGPIRYKIKGCMANLALSANRFLG